MKSYIGTKSLLARPMSLGEYNEYRGWGLPVDENPATRGYLVEYLDGGGANHPDHLHYISWSPAKVFEGAYQPVDQMNFGHALTKMKAGFRVARAGWNGKGMFIFITKGREVPNTKDRSFAHFDGDTVTLNSHIDMRNAKGQYVSGWLASQTDMLANDWMVVG